MQTFETTIDSSCGNSCFRGLLKQGTHALTQFAGFTADEGICGASAESSRLLSVSTCTAVLTLVQVAGQQAVERFTSVKLAQLVLKAVKKMQRKRVRNCHILTQDCRSGSFVMFRSSEAAEKFPGQPFDQCYVLSSVLLPDQQFPDN